MVNALNNRIWSGPRYSESCQPVAGNKPQTDDKQQFEVIFQNANSD